MTSKNNLEQRERAILAELDRRNPSLVQARGLLEERDGHGVEFDPALDTSKQQAAALLAEPDDDEAE